MSNETEEIIVTCGDEREHLEVHSVDRGTWSCGAKAGTEYVCIRGLQPRETDLLHSELKWLSGSMADPRETDMGTFPCVYVPEESPIEVYDEQFEQLAALEHCQWVEWSQSLAANEDISDERRERWEEYWVPYEELPEDVKDRDREWATEVLDILGDSDD